MHDAGSTMRFRRVSRERLTMLAAGNVIAKAIYCAAELGVADHLRDDPKSADELADQAGCSRSHLHRLLMALTSVGIFRRRFGKFEHSDLSRYLCRDHDESVRPIVSFFGGEMYRAIDGLLDTIRTGRGCWTREFDRPIWEYLAERSDRGEIFDSVMSASSQYELPAILRSYDFSGVELIVDVGGGDGYVLGGILARHARPRGVLFDLDAVIARARVLRRDDPAYSRCEFVAGSFFDFVPRGDLHVLRRVLHDWDDADAIRILGACREALAAGGTILIVERVLSETLPDAGALWSDVSMMAFGGRERTVEEYRRLLSEGGFALRRVIDASYGTQILEASVATGAVSIGSNVQSDR